MEDLLGEELLHVGREGLVSVGDYPKEGSRALGLVDLVPDGGIEGYEVAVVAEDDYVTNSAADEVCDSVGGDGDVGGVLGGVPAEVLDALDNNFHVFKLVECP